MVGTVPTKSGPAIRKVTEETRLKVDRRTRDEREGLAGEDGGKGGRLIMARRVQQADSSLSSLIARCLAEPLVPGILADQEFGGPLDAVLDGTPCFSDLRGDAVF